MKQRGKMIRKKMLALKVLPTKMKATNLEFFQTWIPLDVYDVWRKRWRKGERETKRDREREREREQDGVDAAQLV